MRQQLQGARGFFGKEQRGIFGVFFLCLLISTGFWLVTALRNTFETEIEVPLVLAGVPDNVRITTPLPDKVYVSVRDKGTTLVGYRWRHRAMRPLEFNFQDYDNGAVSGRGQVASGEVLRLVQHQLDAATQVQGLRPDTLEFYYNRGLRHRLPVRPQGTFLPTAQSYVQSISVSPDQILRSTYHSELSQRLDIKEQTLLNSMNGMIRKEIEEKEKERLRSVEGGVRSEITPTADNSRGTSPVADKSHSSLLTPHSSEIESLIIKSIIRDGEKVIYEHVEMDDGTFTDLTVAQYVNFDLGQDGIRFHNELYNQILDEAVAHSGEPDFKAETYFMHHPDVNISSLAAHLAIDTHQLGKSFQLKEREGGLRQHVLHLVLDLHMDIVEKRLKELKAEMRQVGSDMERIKALMEEFKETQELRNALAQQLGNDLVG